MGRNKRVIFSKQFAAASTVRWVQDNVDIPFPVKKITVESICFTLVHASSTDTATYKLRSAELIPKQIDLAAVQATAGAQSLGHEFILDEQSFPGGLVVSGGKEFVVTDYADDVLTVATGYTCNIAVTINFEDTY